MNLEVLYYINEFWISIGAIVILLACLEVGYRWGKKKPKEGKDLASNISGALIGFVALLLGFSLSMAIGRFDVRRDLFAQEVNDIQTAYQRLDLLPQKEQAELRPLFRDYVDTRIAYYNDDPDVMRRGITDGIALQDKIWKTSAPMIAQNPNAISISYLNALSEMMDDASKRLTARENHVPEPILWMLFGIAVLAMVINGYSAGVNRERGLGMRMLIILCFVLVLVLIVDLDRPRRGIIVNNPQPMVELRATMK